METAIVYRNGPVKVGDHSSELQKIWSIYDSVKPVGRTGRLDGIYASPNLTGMARWTHANHVKGDVTPTQDLANYAITVCNPERIFFYDVTTYDNTAFLLNLYTEGDDQQYWKSNREIAKEYWDTGVSLREWEEKAKEEYFDPCEWEALVPMDCIVSYTAVPDEEVIKNSPAGARDKIRDVLSVYTQWMESINQGDNPPPIQKPEPWKSRWTYMGRP